MQEPWIYLGKPRPSVLGDGKTKTGPGIHAIFGAEVPFVPSFLSADFLGPIASGTSRTQLLADRQIRFIGDLAAARDHHATFDLRLAMTEPTSDGHGAVSLLFLGKAFCPGPDEQAAKSRALDLWRRFAGAFPREDPFNYPLVPIDGEWLEQRDAAAGEPSRDAAAAFRAHVLEPIPLNEVTGDRFSELRKVEAWDDLVGKTLGVATEGNDDALRLGYYVRDLNPVLSASAMGRLLEALTEERQACMVRIGLRPTMLTDVEMRLLNELLSEYEQQGEATEGWVRLYKEEHLSRMEQAMRNLLASQRNLFLTAIQVIGERERPAAVVEALHSVLADGGAASSHPLQEIQPTARRKHLKVAVSNVRYLEQELWGPSEGGGALHRLPALAGGNEVVGAFRLPVPPESGYLPGIPVRDEPFVRPQAAAVDGSGLSLGAALHRGTDIGQEFSVSLDDLRRHILVAGSTGSGKTNTCLHLLSQLWHDHQVPFLVLYPIAKPDYRLLMADPAVRDDLLVFTAGDRPAPFRFNPFDIPEGILLQTHISNMMRTFETSLHMWALLRMLFREALRDLYVDHGWEPSGARGDEQQRIPTLADFHQKLKSLAGEWSGRYRAELRGDLRQDSEKKIEDLLAAAGSVLNAREADDTPSIIEQILERPTVIELGRIGSATDISLVVGFLVTLLSEHVTSRYRRTERSLQHVTLIEEAHRLMPAQVASQGEHAADPRLGGAEDFAHVLSEVRGFGEAIIISEQTPTKLIPDAVANTHVKVMHWLEDRLSFDLFAQLMNLNERQRHHARTLEPGEAIVRAESGLPALVRIPHYEGEVRRKAPGVAISDNDVKAFMEAQVARLGISLPEYDPWQKPTSTGQRRPAASKPREEPAPQPKAAASGNDDDARIRRSREQRRQKMRERLKEN